MNKHSKHHQNPHRANRGDSNSVKVTSPYNFVPLNEKVFFPLWGPLVSQDIPFKEGVSGTIQLKMTAQTPIFIRGTQYAENRIGHKKFAFMQHQGKYCIPGSSIKGALRSVLEILSFGKLHPINTPKFGVRDFSRNSKYLDHFKKNEPLGGWLYKDEHTQNYVIDYSTETIRRIKHTVIDTLYGTSFENDYRDRLSPNAATTAVEKYKRLKKAYKKIKKTEGKGLELVYHKTGDQYRFRKDEDTYGTLVVTGQAGPRIDRMRHGKRQVTGKFVEFLFLEPNRQVIVDDVAWDNFTSAYKDNSPNDQSDDYKHWKAVLDKGGKVPVFVCLDKQFSKNGTPKIAHFGLSYMHQLPYRYGIGDYIPKAHSCPEMDMAALLFGNTEETSGVKGRVSVKNGYSDIQTHTAFNQLEEHTRTLSGPKASFYPFYLEQGKAKGKLVTYDSDKAQLRGRKRYPIKATIDKSFQEDATKINSTFRPLPAKTTFHTEIVYHNLLPEELGALLSAISFHNNASCRHALGMAKPYGYGAVTTEIINWKGMMSIEAYLKRFEDCMQQQIPNWKESPQLRELFAMSQTVFEKEQLEKLVYMPLEDFRAVKSAQKFLPEFTHFIKRNS